MNFIFQEKRTKQVVMGRLGPSESFAELSVLLNEQITCSVVTATDMTLGVIRPDKIERKCNILFLNARFHFVESFSNELKPSPHHADFRHPSGKDWLIWWYFNPFPNRTWFFTCLQYVFCKRCGKKRNCSFWAISPFPTVFSTHFKNFLPFS